jgi:precorrin-3B synthase
VQLRGLEQADPAELAAHLTAAGMLPSPEHETVRNIAAPPVAPPSVRDLVRALDQRLCADDRLAGLPGRFLFAIGDTGLDADVAAIPVGDAWAVVLAGADSGLRVTPDRVVAALLAAAHAFLDLRAGLDPRPWRLRELPDGPTRVAERLAGAGTGTRTGGRVSPHGPSGGELVGLLPGARAGSAAVGSLAPLGRLVPVQLEVLRRADHLAVTARRGIVVLDLAPEAARRWLTDLAGAGLAVEAGSRWTGVTACAGRPGCAKALADVRADADATSRFVDGLPVHWIGCARGCGSPPGPHVRVEATAEGYQVSGRPPVAGLGETVAAARKGNP